MNVHSVKREAIQPLKAAHLGSTSTPKLAPCCKFIEAAVPRRTSVKTGGETRMAALAESAFVVTVTETEIVNRRPNGEIERVALEDLSAILIETNDSGPFGPDVWWLLLGSSKKKSGCVFPQGATGEDDVLAFAQKLPGFDNRMLMRAMLSTDNERFLCWRRPEK